MSLRFLAAGSLLLLFMKAISLVIAKVSLAKAWKFYFLTIVPSYETWKRAKAPNNQAIRNTLTHCLVFLVITLLYYFFYWKVREKWTITNLGIQYLAAPLVWLIGEWVTDIIRIANLISGRLIPLHHNYPILSKNLTEFWGKRWNTWFYDWFHQVLFKTFKKRPRRALLITFLFSGIGHEYVISLPFYLLTGINVFGTMTAFFVLQGIGVILDNRAFTKSQTRLRYAFQWFWLLANAPLFMNEGTLRLVHAIH